MLPAINELVVLEVTGQLARRRQREAELASDLPDGPLALRADVGEHGDVASRQRWFPAHEREQILTRPAPVPEAPHHVAQEPAELRQLLPFGYHRASVIIE